MNKQINTPMDKETARSLVAGEKVLLNGIIYTARDAAHKRIIEQHKEGKPFPMHLKDIAIYYAGPTPHKPGQVIGSCGPTTSGRMDAYAPQFMAWGETVMIGKGLRSQEVIEAMKKYGAVYLTAIGGAGALLAKCVKKMECIAFEDLGAEAIYKLTVENFPVIVTIDSQGNNLYETGKMAYQKK
ncbi:fumarate hydratase [Sporanaerobium hydrogeniformans]|uniref:Fumarate hydratase n=1 Tax=Sporanaerobium hydrogeniformans TaxID=3072179 RepID=A0AC61DCR8_9FIRM|nr:Fe-S-containing hydro-lyase [Sporanaerobium hydrogeniformans]PHV70833.1 fumarate hydratase [Sporanaerobium hydrogeniformans]